MVPSAPEVRKIKSGEDLESRDNESEHSNHLNELVEDAFDDDQGPKDNIAGPILLWRDPNKEYSPPRSRGRGGFPASLRSEDRFSMYSIQPRYVTRHTPAYIPDPPKLTFFWACQVDVELGPWATPWSYGLFMQCSEAIEIMVEVETVGLGLTTTSALAQREEDAPQSEPGIEYVVFPENAT